MLTTTACSPITLISTPLVGMRMTCHEVDEKNKPDLRYFEEIHEIVAVTWLSASRNFDAIVTTKLVSVMAEAMSDEDKAMRFDWVFCPSGIKCNKGAVHQNIQFASINSLGEQIHSCLLPASDAALNWFIRNRFCCLTNAFEASEEIIDAIPTFVMSQALEAIEQAAIARAASKSAVAVGSRSDREKLDSDLTERLATSGR